MEYQVDEFRCAMCGNCCRGDGYVRCTPDDISRMAAHLGMTPDKFTEEFTRTPEIADQAACGDLWLLDRSGPEQECIMLEGNACRVHAAKPVQCVGFPLKWRTPDVMDYCEGMKR